MERWCLMDRCEGQRLALGLWTFSSEQVDKGVCVCAHCPLDQTKTWTFSLWALHYTDSVSVDLAAPEQPTES